MAKRALITFLWFYSFWYLGNTIALYLGLPDILGPILGIAAGTLVAIDPRRIIWTVGSSRDAESTAPTTAPAGTHVALPSEG
jgi:hypothetical protein